MVLFALVSVAPDIEFQPNVLFWFYVVFWTAVCWILLIRRNKEWLLLHEVSRIYHILRIPEIWVIINVYYLFCGPFTRIIQLLLTISCILFIRDSKRSAHLRPGIFGLTASSIADKVRSFIPKKGPGFVIKHMFVLYIQKGDQPKLQKVFQNCLSSAIL